MTDSYRILGIDPGIAATGYAFMADGYIHQKGVIERNGKTDNPLVHWYKKLQVLQRQWDIEVIAYEDYVYQGNRTSANSPEMWKRIGILELLSTTQPYPQVQGYHPAWWRQELTGDRNANSELVLMSVSRWLEIDPADLAGKTMTDDHMADAAGVAIVAYSHWRMAESGGIPIGEFHERESRRFRS